MIARNRTECAINTQKMNHARPHFGRQPGAAAQLGGTWQLFEGTNTLYERVLAPLGISADEYTLLISIEASDVCDSVVVRCARGQHGRGGARCKTQV